MENKGIISSVRANTGEIYSSRKGNVIRVQFDIAACISDFNRLRVGSIVFYDIKKNNKATNVLLVSHIHVKDKYKLPLPNGKRIKSTNILEYGIKNELNAVIKTMGKSREELEEMGYPKEVFDYVYIRMPDTTYKIYAKETPIIGDGQVDNLNEYIDYLDVRLIGARLKR